MRGARPDAVRLIVGMLGLMAGAVVLAAEPQRSDRDRAGQRRGVRDRLAERRVDRSPAPPVVAGPGDYRYEFRHEGRRREYVVHVPASWRSGVPTPVVLALHGGGGDMDHMHEDERYGLQTASEKAGFLAVFPNGISPLRSGLLASWNAGRCCGRARDERVDDVGFLSEVIRRVVTQASGDRTRVFAIGMSNGALMAYRLACDASFLLRGIMAVAGTDNTTSCTPASPVPVLHVHARNDDHVLFMGGAGPAARDPDVVTQFTSVPETIDAWVRRNRANPVARRVLAVPGATCERHDAHPGGAPVQLCVTETGGHSWPGGTKARAREAPSAAISANDVMWEFFRQLG